MQWREDHPGLSRLTVISRKWGAPVSTCTRAGNMVFVSGMPPFDP